MGLEERHAVFDMSWVKIRIQDKLTALQDKGLLPFVLFRCSPLNQATLPGGEETRFKTQVNASSFVPRLGTGPVTLSPARASFLCQVLTRSFEPWVRWQPRWLKGET